jgi:hypothetical protein
MAEQFLQQAFDAVCKEAKNAETWYVCLMESAPYYGGPEEGGWYGTDTHLHAYQPFNNEEAARDAAAHVEELAAELSAESQKDFGDQCLREMEWLDARGLDADFLPEPDGESEFYVLVNQGVPEESRGCRQYS